MLVRATKPGYYDLKRRKVGEVFELVPVKGLYKDDGKPGNPKAVERMWTPEEQFSPNWMEKVDAGAARAKSKGKPPREAQPLIKVEESEQLDSDSEVI